MVTHYFSEKPGGKFSIFEISVYVRGLSLKLLTAPGIFSYKKLDYGTKTLIEYMQVIHNAKVLDLGTGIGVIGIVYAILSPTSSIYMVDINERAVKIAKMNVRRYMLHNCRVIKSNLFEKIDNLKFDVILSNPPISAGLKTCYALIEESYNHLNKNGLLQIVARHKKGGRRLMEKMKEVFENCEVVAKSGGYWVYLSKKQG
ncbi:MAG: class I SAM-dependent methyltransferase [Candidatus Asgardarchaeia archaeon]